jgi:hypothetical protein
MTLYHTKHGGAIERNHNKLAEMNDNKGLPTVEEAIAEIRTKPVVPPWPTVGVVLGLSRGATYDAIRRGEIEVIEVGRLKKVITAPLRRKLGIEA